MDATPATSPIAPGARGGYFLPGTQLELRLTQAIDSGHQHNGDAVPGVLLSAVKAADGKVLAKGTPVQVTVVSAAPAGGMESYGVLSLQADTVGGVGVYTNVLDFNGQEGHKDLPDSAPAKGTEAMLNTGTVLRFNVQGAGDNFDPMTRPGDGGGSSGSGQAGSGQAGRPAPAAGVNGGAQGTTPSNGTSTPAQGTTQPH